MLSRDAGWHVRAQTWEPLTVGRNLSGSAVYVKVFQQRFADSFSIEIHMPHNAVKALNCYPFKSNQLMRTSGRAAPLPACPGSRSAKSHALEVGAEGESRWHRNWAK